MIHDTLQRGDLFAPSRGSATRRWQGGERVTREIYMDDGTWARLGDKCLPRSPLRHGLVIRRDTKRRDGVWVRWDGDTKDHLYLDHGIDAEESPNEKAERLT